MNIVKIVKKRKFLIKSFIVFNVHIIVQFSIQADFSKMLFFRNYFFQENVSCP